ncbi:MAG TPA: DUF2726 domain-containing protein [Verrucomicrobiae bacterium]|nr:DUF2726 domain-containing protein [Verrucomicrobiae bacterium]
MKLISILVIIVVLVALAAISKRLNSGKTKRPAVYRYARKEFFMNRAEHEFFNVLVAAVGSSYYVFPQVHLSTILDHKIEGQDWRAAFRRINGKSVDFVICDKAYIKPLVAIELDSNSHNKEAVRQRDETVQRILEDADLKLLRFENHGSPNTVEIKRRLAEVLRSEGTSSSTHN